MLSWQPRKCSDTCCSAQWIEAVRFVFLVYALPNALVDRTLWPTSRGGQFASLLGLYTLPIKGGALP